MRQPKTFKVLVGVAPVSRPVWGCDLVFHRADGSFMLNPSVVKMLNDSAREFLNATAGATPPVNPSPAMPPPENISACERMNEARF
jgi:hypothetical protein